jgi:hypothetical protein
MSGPDPFSSPILAAPVLEGDEQSLSGTRVEIPGVGEVIFAPNSASDFPDMEMSQQELVVQFWNMRIRMEQLETRIQSLELMANARH